MKCQILFSGKNKKNIINLSSAENAQRVVKVKVNMVLQIYQKNYYEDEILSQRGWGLTKLPLNPLLIIFS